MVSYSWMQDWRGRGRCRCPISETQCHSGECRRLKLWLRQTCLQILSRHQESPVKLIGFLESVQTAEERKRKGGSVMRECSIPRPRFGPCPAARSLAQTLPCLGAMYPSSHAKACMCIFITSAGDHEEMARVVLRAYDDITTTCWLPTTRHEAFQRHEASNDVRLPTT